MDSPDTEDYRRFLSGDSGAFERIYTRHCDNLFSFCLYVTGDRDLARDIVQDSFVRLLGQRQQIRSIKNWLFICARNACYNALRSRENHNYAIASMRTGSEASTEAMWLIDNVLKRLSPEERELILLREQQAFTISQIGAMLGVSENSVKVRLYRVRKKMYEIGRQFR